MFHCIMKTAHLNAGAPMKPVERDRAFNLIAKSRNLRGASKERIVRIPVARRHLGKHAKRNSSEEGACGVRMRVTAAHLERKEDVFEFEFR